MVNEVLASAPGRLISGRSVTGAFVYGQTLYGRAMVEALDQNGLPIWSCMLDDSVALDAAVVAEDGMAYFAGRFMGALQLCNGEVITGVPGQGVWNENLFLFAVDLNTGILQWSRDLSMTNGQANKIASLAIDPQGRLWYGLSEWGVGRAVRVDEAGMDVEIRVVDGVRVMGTISFDPWGGLYMSGSCDNNGFAFGGEAFEDLGTSGYSMFVLRYKPDGTAGFVEFAADITFQDPTVLATSDGHAYLAGNVFEATQWGDVALSGPNWVSDVFVMRLDSTGTFLWGRESAPSDGTITGDMSRASGPCITMDADDNLYLMADVRGTIDWGNGVLSGSGTPVERRISVTAFADDGSALWSASSAEGGGFSECRTLTAMAAPGRLHFAAHVRDAFTFTPHTTNVTDQQAAVFGELSGLSTVIDDPAVIAPHVSPNPVGDLLNVEVIGVASGARIINAAGQEMMHLPNLTGRSALDVSALPSGIYILRTSHETAVRFVKH